MGKKPKQKYLAVACKKCKAGVGDICVDEVGSPTGTHDARRRTWNALYQKLWGG